MNVTELARRLKMTTHELLELLPPLGFAVGKKAIKIDSNLVDKIIRAVEEYRRKKHVSSQENGFREIKLKDKEILPSREVVFKTVKIPEVIAVKDFAERLKLPVVKVIAELMKNGVMSSLNERIDFTTATIIAEDLGFKVEKFSAEELAALSSEVSEKKLKEILESSQSKNSKPRPPVVVVMGHVDHGKTKLLDAIRQTKVAEGESGGITQHIGAYQARKKDRLITFLDTPGHEAFKSMRSRGSKIADVAIIVIAADDGLKPQTLEVINLVQKEKLPFIVAINKIDKENADLDRVKKELAEINLIPEDWGGKTICAPISAKQKIGLDELLDMVLLVADLEELKADPALPAVGTIIESHIDKGEGPVATFLIQSGTLKAGDLVVIGEVAGKIRVLKDFRGQEVATAPPSMPVKILGLRDIPPVGEILEVTADRKKVKELLKKAGFKKQAKTMAEKPVEEKEDEGQEAPTLHLVLKTDVLGSQEAINEALSKFVDPEARLKVVKKGLGNVTDVDVLDAEGSGGIVVGFHVKASPSAENLARDKGVEILYFKIIYKLLDEIEARLKKLLKPEIVRTELGKIQVLQIFRTEKKEMIAGGKILEGRIRPQTKVKILRGGAVVASGQLMELRSGKQVVSEAVKGEDCGFKFVGEPILEVNDTLEVYQEEVKERALKKI